MRCFFLAHMFSLGCFHCRNAVKHYVFWRSYGTVFQHNLWKPFVSDWLVASVSSEAVNYDHFYCACRVGSLRASLYLHVKEKPASYISPGMFSIPDAVFLHSLWVRNECPFFVSFSPFAALPVPVLDYQRLNL